MGFLILFLLVLGSECFAVSVLTQNNDLARSGANINETILTPANVQTNSFGRLFTNAVDGAVYAQPLYVQNLAIAGGVHDVIFVCTEFNSVYAFDADAQGVTYWHTNLGLPFSSSCYALTPFVGITGTPVIDPTTSTLYLDSRVAAGPAHKLHALDLATGHEKFGGSVTITAANFDASTQHQRPGLLLLKGTVYLAYGSLCDSGTYHGFVIGYNATNLTQTCVFNDTAAGSQGGIWSGGMAPSVDSSNFIYVVSGNGSFDGVSDFGESVIKLSPSLVVQDYSTPSNWSSMNALDTDLGSGAAVVLPPHYVITIGKDGNSYLSDTRNMGHLNGFTQVFSAGSRGDTVGKSPVYWQGPNMQYLFICHGMNATRLYQFNGTNVVTTPVGTAAFTHANGCGGIALSANGTNNGVLWEIGSDSNLRAYDAVHFPKLLWTGSVGNFVKMNCPTVADGKVYVGTTNSLVVFGLTGFLYTQTGAADPALSWGSGQLLQTTNLTGSWFTNPSSSPYTVRPTNPSTFYRLKLPDAD